MTQKPDFSEDGPYSEVIATLEIRIYDAQVSRSRFHVRVHVDPRLSERSTVQAETSGCDEHGSAVRIMEPMTDMNHGYPYFVSDYPHFAARMDAEAMNNKLKTAVDWILHEHTKALEP